MGFIHVLMHLPTILRGMSLCKRDIVAWQPDVVILVDYPGFNLDIAKFVKAHTQIPVYYYIAPKLWAWKEYRIKRIRRDVAELFSILPFEVDFFEGKHHYPIHYVGNPTAHEVSEFRSHYTEDKAGFCQKNGLDTQRPIIALLAGSRQQEVDANLPRMIEAARGFTDCQMVLAGAPGLSDDFYDAYLKDSDVKLVKNQTYPLLAHARAALVTSGTATLETALFRVPQVVCYATMMPRLVGYMRPKVLNVRYVSLVNLIADSEVVTELVADGFTLPNLRRCLGDVLADGPARRQMLARYEEVARRLGDKQAPVEAARLICQLLQSKL
jgi:lipid-A-disaccharide synthase